MVLSNLIKPIYSNFYDENFLEFGVNTPFYEVLRSKCIDWNDLTSNQFYIYLYVRKENISSFGYGTVQEVISGYIIGFDFWSEDDLIGGSPPAGRMSSYGDEHLYVKVI